MSYIDDIRSGRVTRCDWCLETFIFGTCFKIDNTDICKECLSKVTSTYSY